jgi:hypothetical protein
MKLNAGYFQCVRLVVLPDNDCTYAPTGLDWKKRDGLTSETKHAILAGGSACGRTE